MADDFEQRVATVHKDGDTISATHYGFPVLGKKGTDYAFLELDATSGGLKVDIVDATGITVDVDLNHESDDVLIYGSSDGGTTHFAIRTDASGRVVTSDISVGTASYNYITDGTNTMPTMDVNTRAGFVQITDGTDEWSIDGSGYGQIDIAAQSVGSVAVSKDNSANAVGNPLSVAIGDGTTEADVLSGTLDALYVAHTDGTNVMPTMDANTRAGFVQITDGTEELEINSDGSINVQMTQGDTVWDYGTATLVKDTPNTVNSYSPSAGTDKIIGVLVSGFGYCEWDIQFGVTASEATIATIRTTPSYTTHMFAFPEGIDILSTETILVSATNKENPASPASDFTGDVTIIYED